MSSLANGGDCIDLQQTQAQAFFWNGGPALSSTYTASTRRKRNRGAEIPEGVTVVVHAHKIAPDVAGDLAASRVARQATAKREYPGPDDAMVPAALGVPNVVVTPKGKILGLEFDKHDGITGYYCKTINRDGTILRPTGGIRSIKGTAMRSPGRLGWLFLAALSCTGGAQQVKRSENALVKPDCKGKGTSAVLVAGLLDLIMCPDALDHCRIYTVGFLKMNDSINGRLFLSREDVSAGGALFGTVLVRVSPAASTVDWDEVRRADGKLIAVTRLFLNAGSGPRIESLEKVNAHYGDNLAPP